MKIEDMQTLPEFFGVKLAESIWVEGVEMKVGWGTLISASLPKQEEGQALVGCLTGQLKWSKHEPMTAEEENILREIAEWQNNWEALGLTNNGTIYAISKVEVYEVLAPILEKYGEINLEEYREAGI